MQQYIIIAQDGKDEEAYERRKKVRPYHLQGAKELKENNHFVIGGAVLNDDGNMIGSVMIVQFETQEELNDWIRHEPYIKDGVWKTFEVKPFRVADV